jgi:hypothetical protein
MPNFPCYSGAIPLLAGVEQTSTAFSLPARWQGKNFPYQTRRFGLAGHPWDIAAERLFGTRARQVRA